MKKLFILLLATFCFVSVSKAQEYDYLDEYDDMYHTLSEPIKVDESQEALYLSLNTIGISNFAGETSYTAGLEFGYILNNNIFGLIANSILSSGKYGWGFEFLAGRSFWIPSGGIIELSAGLGYNNVKYGEFTDMPGYESKYVYIPFHIKYFISVTPNFEWTIFDFMFGYTNMKGIGLLYKVDIICDFAFKF